MTTTRTKPCNPNGTCHVAEHTSLDCYPAYLLAEYEGPQSGGPELMSYTEWVMSGRIR